LHRHHHIVAVEQSAAWLPFMTPRGSLALATEMWTWSR